MQGHDVSERHYSMFTAFLQKQSGIVLGDSKRYLVRSRLTSMLLNSAYSDLDSLIEDVVNQRNRQLTAAAIDAMTTNETLWFRDGYPFDLLKTAIFPEHTNTNKPLKLWSAACSSGQEPFSIAMSYKEYQQRNPTSRFPLSIVATDLSNEMIEKCKLGEFDELSLSRGGLTPERRRTFFTESGPGVLKVKTALSQLIQFKQQNLFNGHLSGGKYDVIFCRNVLIYFSTESKSRLLQHFAASLSPGGILFLGASESIGDASAYFNLVRCSSGLYYQLKG